MHLMSSIYYQSIFKWTCKITISQHVGCINLLLTKIAAAFYCYSVKSLIDSIVNIMLHVGSINL